MFTVLLEGGNQSRVKVWAAMKAHLHSRPIRMIAQNLKLKKEAEKEGDISPHCWRPI